VKGHQPLEQSFNPVVWNNAVTVRETDYSSRSFLYARITVDNMVSADQDFVGVTSRNFQGMVGAPGIDHYDFVTECRPVCPD